MYGTFGFIQFTFTKTVISIVSVASYVGGVSNSNFKYRFAKIVEKGKV